MSNPESGKSIYVVSDLHLGSPSHAESLKRERHFLNWLSHIRSDLEELYLLGDTFDFWFEYKRVVPKGFVRILGSLAELCDAQIPVHLFAGNHDLWYDEYLPQELGVKVYHKPVYREFFGQKFYLAHGDGLGPGDYGYKLMKRIITHPLSKWLYARLHPNLGVAVAQYVSGMSRKHQETVSPYPPNEFLGDKEFLITHSKDLLAAQEDIAYFVYGHRHILKETKLSPSSTCIFMGDWINFFSYLKINEREVQLHTYPLEENRATSVVKPPSPTSA